MDGNEQTHENTEHRLQDPEVIYRKLICHGGRVDLPYTVPNLFGIIGLCCGWDATDSVVPADYLAPFAFNGEIKSVTLDVTGELIVDHESELKRIMVQQ